jgi:hypothetical protein
MKVDLSGITTTYRRGDPGSYEFRAAIADGMDVNAFIIIVPIVSD